MRNVRRPRRKQEVVESPVKEIAEPSAKLPNIFRKSVEYMGYSDTEVINTEPHETVAPLMNVFVERNPENRGMHISQDTLQKQSDILKIAFNPSSGEPICDSIFRYTFDTIAQWRDHPMVNPDHYNTTDNLRVDAITRSFAEYAYNAFNMLINQANTMFYRMLANELTPLNLKVTLTDDHIKPRLYGFGYNKEANEVIPYAPFCTDLITAFKYGDFHGIGFDKYISNTIVNSGHLCDLVTYNECEDFWALLSCVLPIFEHNHNCLMSTFQDSTFYIFHPDIVNAYIRAYNTMLPATISAVENLIYTLWCESEVYIIASGLNQRFKDQNSAFDEF